MIIQTSNFLWGLDVEVSAVLVENFVGMKLVLVALSSQTFFFFFWPFHPTSKGFTAEVAGLSWASGPGISLHDELDPQIFQIKIPWDQQTTGEQ